MLVSYNWVRELLPALQASAHEVADRLSAAGLAVEGIETRGAALREVRVARVVAIAPHPKRSGLRLVTVEYGQGPEEVVCGASNVPDPGGLVVLAPLGAKLPAFPEPLAARDIGGVKSEGMLCSETELGLASTSEGILILPAGSAQPGQLLSDVVPSAVDTILTLDVTTNRPDALGHLGVARELAALYALPFAPPRAETKLAEADAELATLVRVENRDTERCPHYAAGAVLGVKVAPSPLWLKLRLESLGVRAISNVVDVTNLILLEYAQPMHAFDLDRVRGARIIVRRALAGEPFTTLDGIARKLDADDLVIADAEGPTALAGVMGGRDSEIQDSTTRVLLECAYFSPRGVRRSSRRHGLHTESSHRFERGVDFGAVPLVLESAKRLLAELSGGSVVRGALHERAPEAKPERVTLRSARLDSLLGVPVPFDEASAILERLGFRVTERAGSGPSASITVEAASHRPDVTREVDLIDEVVRVRGLHTIPSRMPVVPPQPPRMTGEMHRTVLLNAIGLGLSEALTYAFVAPSSLARLSAPAPVVKLLNPLGEERSVMRTSLLPGLIDAVGRSRRHGELRVRLFCVGATFHEPVAQASNGARPRQPGDVGTLPTERLGFAALLAGPRVAEMVLDPPEVDVYDAKGIAVEFVERVTNRRATVEFVGTNQRTRHLHPRGAAEVYVDGTLVGRFGPLHPDVVRDFELGAPVQAVEIDLDALEELGRAVSQFRAIPRLPAVTRDLSLVVAEDVTAGRVAGVLGGAGGELCESIEVVAEFRGGSVPAGRRSLTFRVVYRDPKARNDSEGARTLTDPEVDAVEQRMLEAARTELGAALRS